MDYEAYYTKAQTLSEVDFKQIIGVNKTTFSKMEPVLYAAFQIKHVKGGRPPKLLVGVQLLMILKYWRQYVIQKELSFEFAVGEATQFMTQLFWLKIR